MAIKEFLKTKSDNLGVAHIQVPSLLSDTYYSFPDTTGNVLVDNSLPGLPGFVGLTGMTGLTGNLGPTGRKGNQGISPIGAMGITGIIGPRGPVGADNNLSYLGSGVFSLQNSTEIPFPDLPPATALMYCSWESDINPDPGWTGHVAITIVNHSYFSITEDMLQINRQADEAPNKGYSFNAHFIDPAGNPCYFASDIINSVPGLVTIKLYGHILEP